MSDYALARRHMVDGQVRTCDVTDLDIIDAMLDTPRELFVPAHKRPLAYLDLDLDVGDFVDGGAPRRLLKPATFAKLLQAAEISEGDRVLVVGCASGYSAAVISHLTPHVFATEPVAALADRASELLKSGGYSTVSVSNAPVPAGDPTHAPFDVILLEGATEIEPSSLYAQLKDGGRLIGVFGVSPSSRGEVVTRSPGDFGSRTVMDASAPVLPGLERPAEFVF